MKSTRVIRLDMVLNPTPDNHQMDLSNRDTYVVLATGCLMGTHVILSSRFFLLFTGREDAHVSNWHFYFSSFKHPLARSHQVGEAGPGPRALCSYSKVTRRSQRSQPFAQNFRQKREAQVSLSVPV